MRSQHEYLQQDHVVDVPYCIILENVKAFAKYLVCSDTSTPKEGKESVV